MLVRDQVIFLLAKGLQIRERGVLWQMMSLRNKLKFHPCRMCIQMCVCVCIYIYTYNHYYIHIYIHYMYLYGFLNIHTTHKSRYCHHSTVNPLFRVMSNKPTTFLNKTSQKVPSEAHQASRLTQGAGAADRYGAWSTTKAIRQPGEQTEGTQEAASGIFGWNWLPPTERTISSASCDEGASTWKNGSITLSVRYDRMKCLMDRFFGGEETSWCI